jgi:general secretion pathway protein L
LYAIDNAGQPLLLHASASGVTPWPLQASTVALLQWPQDAALRAEPAVAALAEQLFGRSVQLQSRAERALAACQSDWDLAQLDLVNNQRSRSLKRLGGAARALLQAPRWRAVRWSLLALIAVNLLGLNVRAGAERAALQAQRKAIDTVLTGTFPATQVVVDAPVQMQREVEQLRQRSGQLAQEDAEVMLSALMQAANFPAAPIGVHYQSGALQLEGLQLSSTALADLTRAMQARGYQLQAQGATLTLRARGAP